MLNTWDVSELFTCCCELVLTLPGVMLLPCSFSCKELTDVIMLDVEQALEPISASTYTEISWTWRAFKLQSEGKKEWKSRSIYIYNVY